jgi:hypothetical protein
MAGISPAMTAAKSRLRGDERNTKTAGQGPAAIALT